MISFYIDTPAFKYEVYSFQFSAGERQVVLPCMMMPTAVRERLVVQADVDGPAAIMDLLLAVDALKRQYGSLAHIQKTLILPYLPYSRQDRVCAEGEALAIAVFAKLINGLGFNKVVTLDCHSEVGVALIDNCQNIPQHELIKSCMTNLYQHALVIADAGAAKKVYALAKKIGAKNGNEIIKADKVRCPKTGEITGTVVHADNLDADKTYLIADDICDGGKTFIELARKLREKGARNIVLWVTHGIFSKGPAVFNGLINEIHYTDSFPAKSYTSVVQVEMFSHNVVANLIKQEFNEV